MSEQRCPVCGNYARFCTCRTVERGPARLRPVDAVADIDECIDTHDGWCADCGFCADCATAEEDRLRSAMRSVADYIAEFNTAKDAPTVLANALQTLEEALDE